MRKAITIENIRGKSFYDASNDVIFSIYEMNAHCKEYNKSIVVFCKWITTTENEKMGQPIVSFSAYDHGPNNTMPAEYNAILCEFSEFKAQAVDVLEINHGLSSFTNQQIVGKRQEQLFEYMTQIYKRAGLAIEAAIFNEPFEMNPYEAGHFDWS
ncbi:hypothetical protein [Acinetobacter brisouii]|uniref:hypothetical protein n=1 Tax=Acinetobacter brisouii TaxID=396323 RepID=UPI00124C0196|nr:hypothetical protein [Acinetobacter brisouii]